MYNIQGCLRTNDIDGIGDERHLAYFEMMGNRSLGDYFKKEAIERSVEFLCDYLHVSKDRIGATIFA
ncbi:MAG: alanine--tRNA ligase-related protein [bacterium]